MKINDAIRKAMKEKGFTQAQMAKAIGKPSANTVGARLTSDSLSTNNVVEMLDVIGYELVVQPKTQGQRKEGSMVIEKGTKWQ